MMQNFKEIRLKILFERTKMSVSSENGLPIPKYSQPCYNFVDASSIDIGCVTIRQFQMIRIRKKPKLKIFFRISRIFLAHEQKLATIYREITALVFLITIS